MTTLAFYGYSDDVAYCSINRTDYIDTGAFDKTAVAEVKCGEEGCYVTLQYAPHDKFGTWTVGIAPLDEGIDLPEWAKHPEFRTIPDEYTSVLVLEVPDGTEVRWVE